MRGAPLILLACIFLISVMTQRIPPVGNSTVTNPPPHGGNKRTSPPTCNLATSNLVCTLLNGTVNGCNTGCDCWWNLLVNGTCITHTDCGWTAGSTLECCRGVNSVGDVCLNWQQFPIGPGVAIPATTSFTGSVASYDEPYTYGVHNVDKYTDGYGGGYSPLPSNTGDFVDTQAWAPVTQWDFGFPIAFADIQVWPRNNHQNRATGGYFIASNDVYFGTSVLLGTIQPNPAYGVYTSITWVAPHQSWRYVQYVSPNTPSMGDMQEITFWGCVDTCWQWYLPTAVTGGTNPNLCMNQTIVIPPPTCPTCEVCGTCPDCGDAGSS